jgi:hypothetical protein
MPAKAPGIHRSRRPRESGGPCGDARCKLLRKIKLIEEWRDLYDEFGAQGHAAWAPAFSGATEKCEFTEMTGLSVVQSENRYPRAKRRRSRRVRRSGPPSPTSTVSLKARPRAATYMWKTIAGSTVQSLAGWKQRVKSLVRGPAG